MKTTITAIITCLVVSGIITLAIHAAFGFTAPYDIYSFIWGVGFSASWLSVFAITKTCKVLVLDDKTKVIVVDERSNKEGA